MYHPLLGQQFLEVHEDGFGIVEAGVCAAQAFNQIFDVLYQIAGRLTQRCPKRSVGKGGLNARVVADRLG